MPKVIFSRNVKGFSYKICKKMVIIASVFIFCIDKYFNQSSF